MNKEDVVCLYIHTFNGTPPGKVGVAWGALKM